MLASKQGIKEQRRCRSKIGCTFHITNWFRSHRCHTQSERSEHKQSQLCCVNTHADPLMGRAYLSVRATGWERLHPFLWRGEGPWDGVEASPYEGEVGVVGSSCA